MEETRRDLLIIGKNLKPKQCSQKYHVEMISRSSTGPDTARRQDSHQGKTCQVFLAERSQDR